MHSWSRHNLGVLPSSVAWLVTRMISPAFIGCWLLNFDSRCWISDKGPGDGWCCPCPPGRGVWVDRLVSTRLSINFISHIFGNIGKQSFLLGNSDCLNELIGWYVTFLKQCFEIYLLRSWEDIILTPNRLCHIPSFIWFSIEYSFCTFNKPEIIFMIQSKVNFTQEVLF